MPKKHRPMPDLTPEERQRFLSRISIIDDGCWKWLGVVTDAGYGSIKIRQKTYVATRLSYYIHCGIDPGELQVLHKCDNPECTRPDHLYLGTQKQNRIDCYSRGRGSLSQNLSSPELIKEIRRRHQNGESAGRLSLEYGFIVTPFLRNDKCQDANYIPRRVQPQVYLNWDMVNKIRSRYREDPNTTYTSLSNEFGIIKGTIKSILSNKTWYDSNYVRPPKYQGTKPKCFITAFGETKSIREWAEDPRCCVSKWGIVYRMEKGLSGEDLLKAP